MKAKNKALINVTDPTKREELLDFLEKRGYRFAHAVFTREMVIESIYPITVDMRAKTYDFIGNITGAAELSRNGMLISVEEFYVLFDSLK